jgi:hypothetical protein
MDRYLAEHYCISWLASPLSLPPARRGLDTVSCRLPNGHQVDAALLAEMCSCYERELGTRWGWDGSFLRARSLPEGEPGLAICSRTFGVPGVYEQAEKVEAKRAELEAARQARQARAAAKVPKRARKVRPAPAKLVQMELFA